MFRIIGIFALETELTGMKKPKQPHGEGRWRGIKPQTNYPN